MALTMTIIAYCVGSICSAVLICKACHLPDPRTTGSNNPGASNVLRIAGKKYAFFVLIADMLKGFLPVIITKIFTEDPLVLGYVALAAVLGHIFPVYFHFKGGKGVATALGAFLGFNLIMGALTVGTWLLVANFFRYSSLASIVSIIFAPFFSLPVPYSQRSFFPLLIISLIILIKHRENITRISRGEEPKINLTKIKSAIQKDIEEEKSDNEMK